MNEPQLEHSLWRTIAHLAKPYRSRFFLVIFLAAISTGADLVEPLIYRVAVNDVAGLFVQRAREEARAESEQASKPSPRIRTPVEHERQPLERSTQIKEPHRRGHVAPRTPSQTLSTLLWAVALLFAINIAGYCGIFRLALIRQHDR